MGWFLWGVVFGWLFCAVFYSSQIEDEKASKAAGIIFLALGIIAVIVSIALGVSSGSIPIQGTPTPTSLGR